MPKVSCIISTNLHDDVIKWKHFPRYWPFVRGIHRSPVNSPHKGQRRGALMFSLMCARINSWVNNREAGDLRRYRHHYDVIVMIFQDILHLRPIHEDVEVEIFTWATPSRYCRLSYQRLALDYVSHFEKYRLISEYIDGFVQGCSNSIALTMELLQSCAKPSTSKPLIAID